MNPHLRAWGMLSIVVFCVGMAAHAAPTTSPSMIAITFEAPGAEIPKDFAGLSFETKRMLARPYLGDAPDAELAPPRLFSADDKPLVTFFRTMRIRSLRIGGGTAERTSVPMPTHGDIDALFTFAKAVDLKVIYTLRLHDTQPEQVAVDAKYIADHYRDNLSCFELGNEPTAYLKTYDDYLAKFKSYLGAISAVAPDARFCGPSGTRNCADWPGRLLKDLGNDCDKLRFVTQHDYPCGDGRKSTDPSQAVENLLAADRRVEYQKLSDLCMPPASAHRVGFRLEETNNFSMGGAPNTSNTFASALWALDYMHWWAARGAAGLNFHTSDLFPVTPDNKPTWYVAFAATPARHGYAPKPLAYALTAFAATSPSRSVQVSVKNPSNLNLAVYATLTDDGQLVLTLINKTYGAAAASALIALPAKYTPRSRLTLSARQVDATDEIMLGSAGIDEAGVWPGSFEKLPPDASVIVPPTSAMILRLKSADAP